MNKRLYRSSTDRRIAGVCGGLAEYFNIEVFWVRIIFLILGWTSIGVWLYIALMILLPKDYEVNREKFKKSNPYTDFMHAQQKNQRKDVTPDEDHWSDF